VNELKTVTIKQISQKDTKTREQKKAEKEAKKALKLQKKLEKQNRYKLYDPDKMRGSWLTVSIGYILRFFAIAFSLFGVCVMFCDAFQLTDVQWLPLLLYCFGAVCVFSLIFIGKWFTLAGFGLLGAYIGLFFAVAGSPLTFYVTGTLKLINQVMSVLRGAGFAAAGAVSEPSFGSLLSGLVPYGGIFAVATVLAILFSAFSATRTRLLPIILFGGSLCVVCFTYNLCRSNWGIACVLAGLCSAIVLSAYDNVYKNHKKSRKSRAYSGYSAALAGILAMLLVLTPTLAASSPFVDIPIISEPMDEARTYVTTLLTGGNPKYNKMNTLNKQMSAAIDDFDPMGVTLFNVGSGSRVRNIYLRSWIADDFIPGKDVWNVLDDASYSAMRKTLKSEYTGFTGDDITDMLYFVFDPDFYEIPEDRTYYQNVMYGALATYVNIEYVENTGLLYVLPSAFDSYFTRLLEFETTNSRYGYTLSPYSDGMYRSSWFNLRKSYSAYALVPNYLDQRHGAYTDMAVQYYKAFVTFISNTRTADYPTSDDYVQAFKDLLSESEITGNGKIAAYYYDLSASDQRDFFKRYLTLVNEYTAYVKDQYTEVTVTPGLQQVYNEIAPDFAEAETTHAKILTVIDYLVKNCTYSLTPEKPEGKYESDIDAFLLETKDGYCVQFATAAALLLRMFGMPTRYVQGYLATGFKDNVLEDDEERSEGYLPYATRVKDDNAHAWIEVYIDGIGWRTYETTPVYYSNIYHENSELSDALDPYSGGDPDMQLPDLTDPVEPEPGDDQPEEPGEEEEEEEEFTAIDYGLIMRIAVIVLVIAAVLALIIWQIKRARKIVDGRNYYIERAIYGSFEDESDKNKVAGVLCDSVYEVQYIMGNRPVVGEDPTQFASRVDHPAPAKKRSELRKQNRAAMMPNTFTEITGLLEKQEFGKALEREELSVLGEYLRALINAEYRALNPLKKFWYRYIKFMI